MNYNMQVEERTLFHRLDMNLIFVILALNIIGLINLYSATHGAITVEHSRLFWQQILWLMIGWSIFFGVTWIDYDWFKRASWFLYGINVLALVAVDLIGVTAYGAQRWLNLGFMRYQPSETMKIVLVFVMATILAEKAKPEGLGFRELIFPTLIAVIPARSWLRAYAFIRVHFDGRFCQSKTLCLYFSLRYGLNCNASYLVFWFKAVSKKSCFNFFKSWQRRARRRLQ